jgi:hypothetical protein
VVGPTAPGRANPTYIPWPSAGWFPNPMTPARWSLSGQGLKFGKAKVSVYRAGHRLPTHQERVVNGYGLPTLVWTMPTGFAKTGSYQVVVKNIHRVGEKKKHHKKRKKGFTTSYWVTLFTPRH